MRKESKRLAEIVSFLRQLPVWGLCVKELSLLAHEWRYSPATGSTGFASKSFGHVACASCQPSPALRLANCESDVAISANQLKGTVITAAAAPGWISWTALGSGTHTALDSYGNMPSMPSVFPDWEPPIVRSHAGSRGLVKMHWGLPNPPQHGGINTNIRDPTSPHWRRWLKPENRCLVPATSFSEYNDKPNPASLKSPDGSKHPMAGKKDVVWFALDKTRPLFSFAGIWTEGARGTKLRRDLDAAETGP